MCNTDTAQTKCTSAENRFGLRQICDYWQDQARLKRQRLWGVLLTLPKTHKVPPEVDFESSRSPAKSES